MAQINPYQAPQAAVNDVDHAGAELAGEPRALDAGRGAAWIAEGWGLFRQAPAVWMAITVIELVVFVMASFVPIIGQLAGMMIPVLFAGGLMIGCRALDRGEDLTIGHLFAGFQTHLSPLVVIGAVYLAAMIALIAIAALFTGGAAFALYRGTADIGVTASSILLAVLIIAALSIPVAMAIWFAPALVTLHDLSPTDAIKRSLAGCAKNILPFLVYGILAIMLAALASLPLALGWLILLPVLAGSIYAAYRDIFLQR